MSHRSQVVQIEQENGQIKVTRRYEAYIPGRIDERGLYYPARSRILYRTLPYAYSNNRYAALLQAFRDTHGPPDIINYHIQITR